MSDLQIGLVAVGVLVVAGIFAYNALQERRARRAAERAFRSGHADVLMDGGGQRVEPRFDGPSRRAPPSETAALPDRRLDYIVELELRQAASAAEVAAHWAPFEHRFAGRALLAASPDRAAWRPLTAAGSCVAVLAALQLASRSGPVSEAQLIEFRGAVDTLAAQIGAGVSAPEIKQAVDAARELDALCADADIQVVLHVVPQPGGEFAGAAAPQAPGTFGVARRDDGGYVLSIDVPRSSEVRRTYDAMVVYARDLCATLGGMIVDDNARVLDEHALAAIGAQLETVRATLEARGIEPGSPAALRLFS
ncbi:MAG TPA: cell division protein ZipA C-terminal FtsZ-binding domain-containing protein [Burkholderiales bacterium]|nr:cell division protein ZipA C-terminal FtsZ-binding domain-containing protein [Burkholderiales bacterium]